MTTLFIHIKELTQIREPQLLKVAGKDMKTLPTLHDAYLLVENDTITAFGKMTDIPDIKADAIIACHGRIILPTWCDSHTHLVFADNRTQDFIDRINGLSYQEIAARGGGILNSANKLRQASEETLYESAEKRLREVMLLGTGAIEIKSGYGLTPQSEYKMLRIIKKLKENHPLPIKATFLGAHALPEAFKDNKDGYIHQIIHDILPQIAAEKLADFIDVFCETGYFSVADTNQILEASSSYQLIPKIHTNQFTAIGGIQVAVKHRALSVDHLEVMRAEDVESLKKSETMPVALPGCSFFLNIPYAPARNLIDAGLPLALATDYNPGSAPSGNMNFVIAAACTQMKLTPEEAINAATLNGAYAMNLSARYGSITTGKKANLILTHPIPSYQYLPYAFGTNCIDRVMIHGKFIS